MGVKRWNTCLRLARLALLCALAAVVGVTKNAFSGPSDLSASVQLPAHPPEDKFKKPKVVVRNAGTDHESVRIVEERFLPNGTRTGRSETGLIRVHAGAASTTQFGKLAYCSSSGDGRRVWTVYHQSGRVIAVMTLRFRNWQYR